MEKSPVPSDETPDLNQKPPAATPISSAWDVFCALAVSPGLSPDRKRHMQHSFYAGARSTFRAVVDAMQEQVAGNDDGEARFAAIELEIDKYFTQMMAQAAISRVGKA